MQALKPLVTHFVLINNSGQSAHQCALGGEQWQQLTTGQTFGCEQLLEAFPNCLATHAFGWGATPAATTPVRLQVCHGGRVLTTACGAHECYLRV